MWWLKVTVKRDIYFIRSEFLSTCIELSLLWLSKDRSSVSLSPRLISCTRLNLWSFPAQLKMCKRLKTEYKKGGEVGRKSWKTIVCKLIFESSVSSRIWFRVTVKYVLHWMDFRILTLSDSILLARQYDELNLIQQ